MYSYSQATARHANYKRGGRQLLADYARSMFRLIIIKIINLLLLVKLGEAYRIL